MTEKFQVVYKWATFEFTPRESGGYDANVPAISNCASGGETFEDALLKTFEALMVRLREDYRSGMAIDETLLPLIDSIMEEGETQYHGG